MLYAVVPGLCISKICRACWPQINKLPAGLSKFQPSQNITFFYFIYTVCYDEQCALRGKLLHDTIQAVHCLKSLANLKFPLVFGFLSTLSIVTRVTLTICQQQEAGKCDEEERSWGSVDSNHSPQVGGE